MTAAQKAARVKFNKAIAIRKKTGCTLKEAFAQVYGKKVGAVKKKAAKKRIGLSVVKKAAAKVKRLARNAQDAFYEGYYEGKPLSLAKKRAELKKKRTSPKKKKISEQAILNKIHRVKKDVDVLDEAQHKHMMGGRLKLSKGESKLGLVRKQPKKLSLPEQIGKIKMGSVFIYWRGYSIEKMLLTIQGRKKKEPIYIVHEFGDTYKTLAAAKAAIKDLGR
jgi:hypothetical protein